MTDNNDSKLKDYGILEFRITGTPNPRNQGYIQQSRNSSSSPFLKTAKAVVKQYTWYVKKYNEVFILQS